MRRIKKTLTVGQQSADALKSINNESVYVDSLIRKASDSWQKSLILLYDSGWTVDRIIKVIEAVRGAIPFDDVTGSEIAARLEIASEETGIDFSEEIDDLRFQREYTRSIRRLIARLWDSVDGEDKAEIRQEVESLGHSDLTVFRDFVPGEKFIYETSANLARKKTPSDRIAQAIMNIINELENNRDVMFRLTQAEDQ